MHRWQDSDLVDHVADPIDPRIELLLDLYYRELDNLDIVWGRAPDGTLRELPHKFGIGREAQSPELHAIKKLLERYGYDTKLLRKTGWIIIEEIGFAVINDYSISKIQIA